MSNINTTAATIIASANNAKAAVVSSALTGGDMKAFAVALRPAGEFARVSCPSSLEFGDEDINYHGKRLSGLAAGHEMDLDRLTRKVEAFEQTETRMKRGARHGDGREIVKLHEQCNDLRRSVLRHQAAIVRIDGMIAVMKEELALRQQDRDAHKARVAAERVAREAAAVVAVTTPLPSKWLRPRSKVKAAPKARADRNAVRLTSLADLAELEEIKAVNAALIAG